MLPQCPQCHVDKQYVLTVMPRPNEKAITIAVSLLKQQNPQTIQTLKDLLTFIPNPNHAKEVLRNAVLDLIYIHPPSVLWLFQHPELLEEIQVRAVIVQELSHKLDAWGYTTSDFCWTADHRLEMSEATRSALRAQALSPTDAAALTLMQALLEDNF